MMCHLVSVQCRAVEDQELEPSVGRHLREGCPSWVGLYYGPIEAESS